MSKDQVSDTFKQSIKLWVELTNQKAAVNKDMAVINQKLKELKAYITTYMSTNQLDGCNVQGNRVSLAVSKSKETLTRDVLTRLITEYRKGDAQESPGLAEYILNNRKTKDTFNLRKATIPGYALSMQDEVLSRRETLGDNVKDTASSSSRINVGVLRTIGKEEEGIADNEYMFEDDA